MARTKVSDNVSEKIVNRLTILNMKVANGNEAANREINAILWTLKTVGFTDEVIADLSTQASDLAE